MNEQHSLPLLMRLCSEVFLIEPGAMQALLLAAQAGVSGKGFSPGANPLPLTPNPSPEGIAIVPVHGPLVWNPSAAEREFFGLSDIREVTATVQAAADGPARGIFLDIDSPGGGVAGSSEAIAAIAAASQIKPVLAWTGHMMASLAYGLGSQAGTTVATDSAGVGGVGAWVGLFDVTGMLDRIGIKAEVWTNREGIFKATGFPGKPVTEAQRAEVQAMVDAAGDEFIARVSARRTIQPEALRGQTMSGKKALAAGLIDATASRTVALRFLAGLAA